MFILDSVASEDCERYLHADTHEKERRATLTSAKLHILIHYWYLPLFTRLWERKRLFRSSISTSMVYHLPYSSRASTSSPLPIHTWSLSISDTKIIYLLFQSASSSSYLGWLLKSLLRNLHFTNLISAVLLAANQVPRKSWAGFS